jgi:phage terminase large subunit
MSSVMRVSFPNKLRMLFTNSRYKVLVGGRGGAKSWGIARALLLLGANQTLRVLCCREIQKSLKDSVMQLLKDQITALGLDEKYNILETEIRGRYNDTLFVFTGLQDHTAESVKSFEGFDVAWCEEAQTISKRSMTILTPTIRKETSEIWLSLNPILDTDYVYTNYVIHPPPGSQVVQMNFTDNPWFPQVLEAERLHCLNTDPEGYRNIWLGEPMSAVPGAIYAKEMAALIREGRHCFVPYDPRLRVHTVWDMGWNDAMVVILFQVVRSECRILDYLEFRFKRTDEVGTILQAMPYNWGWDWLPHDAYDKERKTGTCDADILKRLGRKVRPEKNSVPNLDEEAGIRATRLLFLRLVINNVMPVHNQTGTGTERLIEVLKRFARNIPKTTLEPALPIKNEHKHGSDALRYLALVVDKCTNEYDLPKGPPIQEPYYVHGLTGVMS